VPRGRARQPPQLATSNHPTKETKKGTPRTALLAAVKRQISDSGIAEFVDPQDSGLRNAWYLNDYHARQRAAYSPYTLKYIWIFRFPGNPAYALQRRRWQRESLVCSACSAASAPRRLSSEPSPAAHLPDICPAPKSILLSPCATWPGKSPRTAIWSQYRVTLWTLVRFLRGRCGRIMQRCPRIFSGQDKQRLGCFLGCMSIVGKESLKINCFLYPHFRAQPRSNHS
jgi:hypothetical protein